MVRSPNAAFSIALLRCNFPYMVGLISFEIISGKNVIKRIPKWHHCFSLISYIQRIYSKQQAALVLRLVKCCMLTGVSTFIAVQPWCRLEPGVTQFSLELWAGQMSSSPCDLNRYVIIQKFTINMSQSC